MRRHATLAALVLTLAFAGSAAAHEEGGYDGGPYTGGGCGGHYISPYTGSSWWDCQSDAIPDRVVTVWTWDRRAYFNVYRTYAHIRDGQFSYRSERFIYSFS